MEPYIMKNRWMRMKASKDLQKDFHKLLNKAVYGKTCENQRKRKDIHRVTENEQPERVMDKTHCLDLRMFDERLVRIEMRNLKLLLNKPSYVGFAVLELSNLLLLRYSNSLLPFRLYFRFTRF